MTEEFWTVFVTVTSGVLVFIFSQFLLEFVFKPLAEKKKLKHQIRFALVYYANLLTSPFPINQSKINEDFEHYNRSPYPIAAQELRKLASEMSVYRGELADRISHNLIGLSNGTWVYEGGTTELGIHNHELIDEVEKYLKRPHKEKWKRKSSATSERGASLKKRKQNQVIKAMIPVFIFIIYLILDFFNVPVLLGLFVNQINASFFGAVLNATIVVSLYIITFYFIDKRQIQKDTNAKETADVMLMATYKECLSDLDFICDTDMVEKYIIPKVDGNKVTSENRAIVNLQNLPFETKSDIMALAQNGHISKNVLANYILIQREYKHIVDMKITFFDLLSPETPEQQALYQDINTRCANLKALLNMELNRLSK